MEWSIQQNHLVYMQSVTGLSGMFHGKQVVAHTPCIVFVIYVITSLVQLIEVALLVQSLNCFDQCNRVCHSTIFKKKLNNFAMTKLAGSC